VIVYTTYTANRHSGFSTALVGSSNLTQAAQATGLEWNVRVSAARNRPVIEKFNGTFEAYWSSGERSRRGRFAGKLRRLADGRLRISAARRASDSPPPES
jgi:hypothetical protein